MHLVCEDAVESVVVEFDHPVEATDLVVSHRSVDERRRLVELERSLVPLAVLLQQLLVFLLLSLATSRALLFRGRDTLGRSTV